MSVSQRRLERLKEQLYQEISLIIQNEIKDPRLSGIISVISLDLSKDLHNAIVYISVYSNKDIELCRKKNLDALHSSRKYIMYLLSKKLKIKYIPELEFRLDLSMEEADRINKILKENTKKGL